MGWAILVSDDRRLPDPRPALARIRPGAFLLARHYDSPIRADLIAGWAKLARARRVGLLVAADWRLAARLGADGLHLPEHLARHGCLAPALGWVRRRRAVLTVACHGQAALARASALNATAALLSPVFPTASHPGAAAIGPARWRLWARRAGLAVIALGGVGQRQVRFLRPAAGFAAIGGWR
ncbi:MAG: thiamine phosphate synthase [Alphaproteobacteria bacterium]|nr:thiamine phosphate synthase [Alphaproteobacteria bacterium]